MSKKRRDRKKTKFRDRKSVIWIKENAPHLLGNSLEFIGDVTGIEALEKLGEKIAGEPQINFGQPEDKNHLLELIRLDLEYEREITERWVVDVNSKSWLSRNVRPLILLYSWFMLTVMLVLAWCDIDLPIHYVNLFEVLAVAVTGGYFALRTVEKRNIHKYGKNGAQENER